MYTRARESAYGPSARPQGPGSWTRTQTWRRARVGDARSGASRGAPRRGGARARRRAATRSEQRADGVVRARLSPAPGARRATERRSHARRPRQIPGLTLTLKKKTQNPGKLKRPGGSGSLRCSRTARATHQHGRRENVVASTRTVKGGGRSARRRRGRGVARRGPQTTGCALGPGHETRRAPGDENGPRDAPRCQPPSARAGLICDPPPGRHSAPNTRQGRGRGPHKREETKERAATARTCTCT